MIDLLLHLSLGKDQARYASVARVLMKSLVRSALAVGAIASLGEGVKVAN